MEINTMWQNAFQQELRNNLYLKSNGGTKQLLIIDVVQECIWYSCDMCLHYYRTGGIVGISSFTIDNITYNVCVAMKKIVPEFNNDDTNKVLDSVRKLMINPVEYDELQRHVDQYYGR